jgi:hypothetical protein
VNVADYIPNVRHHAEVIVLCAPNMRYVYEFGDEFGPTGYIVAESGEDAYEEMLDYLCGRDGVCDHGGDDDPDCCDCKMDSHGHYVYTIYDWMRRLHISPEMFFLAFPDDNVHTYLKH